MAMVFHIAEVAAILTVAYTLGWVLGYVARQVVASRPMPALAGVPAERLATVTSATEVVVPAAAATPEPAPATEPVPTEPAPAAEPVPAPPPVAPAPAIPAEVAPAAESIPVTETVAAEPTAALPPVEPIAAAAPVATEPPPPPSTTPAPVATAAPPAATTTAAPAPPPRPKTVLPPMDIPEFTVPTSMRLEPIAPAPKPAPTPKPEPEPVVPFTATPSSRPGVAWTGEIRGRESRAVAATAPVATKTVFDEPPIEVPVSLELTETIAFVAEPAPTEALELDSSAVAAPPALVEPVMPPPAKAPPVHDEDAAMRAIEGGWSRARTRALPDAPEPADVGAAVAAAQTAVEQVLARAGIDVETSQRASKPEGLARPRDGRRDDLKKIEGLGPLDEATLNNLGVYHYDQIVSWDDAQVLWMENHVFARGRIAREGWQAQARRLAATSGT